MYLSGRLEVYQCAGCQRVTLHGYGGPKRPGAKDAAEEESGVTIVDGAGAVISIDGPVRVLVGECATCSWDQGRDRRFHTSHDNRVAQDSEDAADDVET